LRESAFSLIETLVALLLLSIVSAGAGQLLLAYRQSYARSTLSQEILVFSISLIEAMRNNPIGFQAASTASDWQEKLNKLTPDAACVIVLSQPESYRYAVAITCQQPLIKPIEFIVNV